MQKFILIVLTSLFMFFMMGSDSTQNAFAHPGRTDAQGGHTCRTNCSSWGLRMGQYHKHRTAKKKAKVVAKKKAKKITTKKSTSSKSSPINAKQFSCNCARTCSQVVSCAEAYYQLNSCGCTVRDADNDGIPCENICK